MSNRADYPGHPSEAHVPVTQIYRKLEIVGKGSYGAVYKGEHIPSGTIVALKIIDLDTEDDDAADIQREVALLSQLRGEGANVTQYYGSWLDGPNVWIVMDFAGGGSVRTLMKAMANGVLEERWIVVIIREILIALAYLHKSNVIHRDIKTANMLVQSSGKVVLCDFGVSALLSSSHSKRTTFTGTPHYMAPEVISSSSYDSKADIWSLGITIFEMATGSQPLAELPSMQALALIPKAKPPRLTEQQGGKEMRDFMTHCLKELPSDRSTADELSRHKWIKNSSKTPSSSLRELLLRYDKWAQAGGVRQSLAEPAPWEMDSDRSDQGEGSDVNSWEFDTLRAQFSNEGPAESDFQSPQSLSSPALAHPPASLRALFEDGTAANPQGPFKARAAPAMSSTAFIPAHPPSESPSPFSESRPFLRPATETTVSDSSEQTSQTLRPASWTEYDGSTARPIRSNSDAIAEDGLSSNAANLRAPSYREVRNNRGLADITIPTSASPLTDSENISISPVSTNLSVDDEAESSGTQTGHRKRNIASPVNFHFPPSNNGYRPRAAPVRPSPPGSSSPASSSLQSHHTTISLDDLRPPAHLAKTSIGTPEAQHGSTSGSGLKAKRPSLNRQASVAVMETVSTPSPRLPPSSTGKQKALRERPINFVARADAESSSVSGFRPGTKLKEVLKLSPLPPERGFAADMLPPSPATGSPVHHYFSPSPSSLSLSTTAQDNIIDTSPDTSISVNHTTSPSSDGRPPQGDSLNASSNSYQTLHLRPFNYNTLLSSREETHAELGRTVDDLVNLLQEVENGLASVLEQTQENTIEELEEIVDLESYNMSNALKSTSLSS